MKKIILIMLSIFALTACTKEVKEVKSVKFNSYDTNFEITANSNWIDVSDKGELNENANIELYDEKNQKYLIAITESKKDIPWKYDEYRNYILDREAAIYNFDVSNTKNLKLGDYDINYISFVTDIDSKSFYMSIYVIETKNYYGQIIVWTKSSMKDKVDDEFNEIVKSFREIEETKEEAKSE